MKTVTCNPKWAKDFVSKTFSSGPYMGEDGVQWMKEAKSWLYFFCKEIGATEFEFHKGHYEFSGFFRFRGQLWYFSSGDVRFKIMKSMLIRTAKHNKDYTGGRNLFVSYDTKNFKYSLIETMCREIIQLRKQYKYEYESNPEQP